MKRLLALLACSLAPSVAGAGLFGYSSYEDCVLDRMKGQHLSMRRIAEEACRKEFPEEARLRYQADFTFAICDVSRNEISACVVPIWKGKITRARLEAWEGECGVPEKPGEGFISVETKPPMFGNTYKFDVPNAAKYKCFGVTLFGLGSS